MIRESSPSRRTCEGRYSDRLGSARLDSGDGSRTTSRRQRGQVPTHTHSSSRRREVESARKQLVASTKELSKQINETLLVSVFRRSTLARRFTPVRLGVDSLLSDSNNHCWEAGVEAPRRLWPWQRGTTRPRAVLHGAAATEVRNMMSLQKIGNDLI